MAISLVLLLICISNSERKSIFSFFFHEFLLINRSGLLFDIGIGTERRVEKSLAVSAIRTEEKKHEQGCKRKHVMGSSSAQAKGKGRSIKKEL